MLRLDNRSKSRDGSDIENAVLPGCRGIRDALQAETPRDGGNEVLRFAGVVCAERMPDRFAPNPESAAFVAECRSPATGADHGAVTSTRQRNGTSAGNKKDPGPGSNGAHECDERVGFNDHLRPGEKCSQARAIELDAFGTASA